VGEVGKVDARPRTGWPSFEVEQLARDAKVLQIYARTDEIQVSAGLGGS
jgi:alkylation response protein AidB-like acyl-CoA dehydrogenase